MIPYSYHIFKDSAELDCAPSFLLQQAINSPVNDTNYGIIFINAALSKGWYVTITDYEGPKAAFSAGIRAGKATLDSIRATLKSTNITKISPQAKAIMLGYSGGSTPSQFARPVTAVLLARSQQCTHRCCQWWDCCKSYSDSPSH
jgi:hypothetical protein